MKTHQTDQPCEADLRERIASAIEDAALHVLTTANSDSGAALTAAVLERAALIARSVK